MVLRVLLMCLSSSQILSSYFDIHMFDIGGAGREPISKPWLWQDGPSRVGITKQFVSNTARIISFFINWRRGKISEIKEYGAGSSRQIFHDSIEKVIERLQQNMYPSNFYETISSNTIKKRGDQEDQEDQNNDVTKGKSNIIKHYRGTITNNFIKTIREHQCNITTNNYSQQLKTCLPSRKCVVKNI